MIRDIEDILTPQKKKSTVPFKSIGLLPVKEDNAAIATKNIEKGTTILFEQSRFEIDCNVLEGHRFCVRKIHKDSYITSWGMPFAVATRDLSPGQYLCNGTSYYTRSPRIALNELKNENTRSNRIKLERTRC